MRTNVAAATLTPTTHEGGTAGRQTPLVELTRAVSTCLLWEDTFYEKGGGIAARIADLSAQVTAEDLSALAIRARTDLKLRHAPLFLARQMARLHKGRLVGDTIASVIQRPDELSEFLALYWKDKRQPLSAQVKRGLRLAFAKFDAFSLAKWDRPKAIKLRDVLFLCHAKPKDAEQDETWKRLIKGALPTPDTWEVALSSGADKRATWERLLRDGHLGYMALLMNLRNMTEAGVDSSLVEQAIRDGAPRSRALPFRFVSAAKRAPAYAAALSDGMISAVTARLPGETVVVIDVSGSMDEAISARSELKRWEAAGALAVMLREMTPACRVFTFSQHLVEVSNFRGLPMLMAVENSQPHGGTYLAGALKMLAGVVPNAQRVVVVTDEQSQDGTAPCWAPFGYLVNVAPYQPGLDISQGWRRISGWSERIVDWIAAEEAEPAEGYLR
jgi:hypothetical protein